MERFMEQFTFYLVLALGIGAMAFGAKALLPVLLVHAPGLQGTAEVLSA